MVAVCRPEMVRGEVNTENSDPSRPHVAGKCNCHIRGISKVGQSISHDFNASRVGVNAKRNGRDIGSTLFARSMSKDELSFCVFDEAESIVFVL